MSLLDLETGDCVRVGYFVHNDGVAQLSYKAPKGKVFVLCLLGVEPKDTRDASALLDTKGAFRELGWVEAEPASEAIP